MPENNFERAVKGQLDELRFRPSPEVWTQLEEELRKKKRRRVIIWLPLLLGLMLVGVFALRPDQWKKKERREAGNRIVQNAVRDEGAHNIGGVDERGATQRQATQRDVSQHEASQRQATQREASQRGVSQRDISQNSVFQPDVSQRAATEQSAPQHGGNGKGSTTYNMNERRPHQDVIRENETSARNVRQRLVSTSILKNSGDAIVYTEPPTVQQPVVSAIKLMHDEFPLIAFITDSLLMQHLASAIVDSPLLVVNTTATPAPVKKQRKAWTWVIDGSMGVSNRISHDLGTGKSAQQAMLDNSTIPSGGVSNPNPSVPADGPSDYHPAVSGHLHLLLEHALTRRTNLSVGLGYAYYSSRLMIGSSQAPPSATYSSTSYLYSGIRNSNFTDSYHYIDVPINVGWVMASHARFPLRLNAGLNVGYLLSSNAVQYDRNTIEFYYRNKQSDNKLQIQFTSGIDVLLGKRNLRWSLGPDLRIGLNKLSTAPYDDRQFLIYGGVSAKFFLPKK